MLVTGDPDCNYDRGNMQLKRDMCIAPFTFIFLNIISEILVEFRHGNEKRFEVKKFNNASFSFQELVQFLKMLKLKKNVGSIKF